MRKKKPVDPIPAEFASYQEAAEFWDSHDTTDYPEAFRTVRAVAQLRNRRFEIPIDADVAKALETRALKAGVTMGHLASNLLRQRLRNHA